MPDLKNQAAKAEAFQRMHRGSRVLVLPNAWDVASARIFEEAGAPAIAFQFALRLKPTIPLTREFAEQLKNGFSEHVKQPHSGL